MAFLKFIAVLVGGLALSVGLLILAALCLIADAPALGLILTLLAIAVGATANDIACRVW